MVLPREKPRTPGVLAAASASDPFSSPPLRMWFTTFWKDILAMALMGGIALGVHLAPPAPSRTFPINFSDGEIVMPQFAYETRTQIIPVWAAVLLAGLVPIFFFSLAQVPDPILIVSALPSPVPVLFPPCLLCSNLAGALSVYY